MRRALLLFCLSGLLLLNGCAGRGPTGLAPADPALAQHVWDQLHKASQNAETQSGPFRINAALYYAGKEGSQRVTVYFWGDNAARGADGKVALWPLRLDILMGPGQIMGKIIENSDNVTVYVPRDATAYYHTGHDSALLAFGVPMPLSLADLSLLLTGQFERFFAHEGGNAAPPAGVGPDGSLVYTLTGKLAGSVELTPNGLPRLWREGNGDGWQLTVEYWEDSTRTTPRKLHISHPQGAEATLVVRELARPAPFAPGQLELALPQDTRFAPLRAQNQ